MWNKVGAAQWEHVENDEQHYLLLDAPEGDEALMVEMHDGTMHVYAVPDTVVPNIDPGDPLQGTQHIWTMPHDEHTPWLRACEFAEAESAMRAAAASARKQA